MSDTWKGGEYRIALWIFIAALAFRALIFSQYAHGFGVSQSLGDESPRAYQALAVHILSGDGFVLGEPPVPTVRRPPGYPAFVAMSYAVGGLGNAIPSLVLQIILDATTALLVFFLGRLAWPSAPRWTAAAAAMLYAFNPYQAFLAAGTMPETLFTFLLVSGVTLLALSLRAQARPLAFAAGLIFALAALTRAVALGFTVLLLVGLVISWTRRRTTPTHELALLAAAGFVLLVGPWTYRNYAVAGEFIPIHSGFGHNLYLPSFAELDQKDQRSLYDVYLSDPVVQEAGRLSPVAGDALLTRAAISKITAQPGLWLRSRAENYPFLFVYGGDFMVERPVAFGDLLRSRDWGGLTRKGGYALVFSVIPLLLAARAGVRTPSWNAVSMLVAGFWIYNAVFHLATWIEPRFYAPAVPFLYAWAGAGLARWTSGPSSADPVHAA